MAYHITSGACYRLQVHLVLVTKYRKKVINKQMLSRLKQIFRDTCFKWESSVVEFNAEEDPVHSRVFFAKARPPILHLYDTKFTSTRILMLAFGRCSLRAMLRIYSRN